MDKLVPLGIPIDRFLELAESRPLELFRLVKRVVEGEVGQVKDVRVYRKYLDPRNLNIVVEYFVKCSLGEISVKLVYSDDLAKTLERYYEAEKSST